MDDILDLITRLRDYCAKKTGSVCLITFGGTQPSYHLLSGFLDSFAIFNLGKQPYYISLRCPLDLMGKFNLTKSLTKSVRYHWETIGWEWVDVPFDKVSEAQFYELIDASYKCVYQQLSNRKRELVDFSQFPRTPYQTLDMLIESHGLSHHKNQIDTLIGTQILLHTTKVDEDAMSLGQTKIGGFPDLPVDWQIPIYKDQPLAFIAQINLSEIPVYMRNSLLPQTGILYFFSGLGWRTDDGDFALDLWEDEAVGFSQVLYFDGDESLLKRHITALPNSAIQSRSITFSVMPSINDDFYEIIKSQYVWKKEDIDRFFEIQWDYRELVIGRVPQHQLLGYPQWIQGRRVPKNTILLFQIDSEISSSDLMWGDLGKIYFMIHPEDLMNRDFSSIYSEFQCY